MHRLLVVLAITGAALGLGLAQPPSAGATSYLILAMTFHPTGSASNSASIDSTAGEANMSPMSTAAPRACHIEGSMYVEDSPAHPYRVGVTRVGDNCEVTEGYEDLSAKDFGALIAEARDEADITVAPLPVSALRGSPDAILAAASTQKIRGYHHGQHLGVKMVEVRSELRWWYNGVSVTSYGEGVCGRWAGSCWNFAGGGLGCWWEADDMPQWIDLVGQSGFSVAPACWAGCPGCGGTLTVTTTGQASGTHGAYCQHTFSAPPGSTWYCYHVHL